MGVGDRTYVPRDRNRRSARPHPHPHPILTPSARGAQLRRLLPQLYLTRLVAARDPAVARPKAEHGAHRPVKPRDDLPLRVVAEVPHLQLVGAALAARRDQRRRRRERERVHGAGALELGGHNQPALAAREAEHDDRTTRRRGRHAAGEGAAARRVHSDTRDRGDFAGGRQRGRQLLLQDKAGACGARPQLRRRRSTSTH
eukprot:690475-Prymnesium_polylepis.2